MEHVHLYVCACVWFNFVPRKSNCLFADYTDSGGGTKDDPFTLGTDKTTLGWQPRCCKNVCECVAIFTATSLSAGL